MEAAIANYQPVKVAASWPVIGDFVRAAVRDCDQKTAYSARELMIVGSALVDWCHARGYDLDRDVVFRREVISEFIATGLPGLSVATAGNYRTKLLRMSEHLLSPQYRTVRLPAVLRSDAARPYTAGEVVMLRSWVTGQNTTYRRANAASLTALCLGAGLSAAELTFVTAGHVTTDAEGVLVAVEGPRARLVPVLAEWEDALMDVTQAAATPNEFLFRADRSATHRHLVSNFVDKTTSCGVRPSSQRMRATWLVGHMVAGVRADVLLAAAGIESLESLTRYLQYMPQADRDTTRRALRASVQAVGA